LIFENVASLKEIETHWSLDDVLRAIAILDLKAELQAERTKKR